MCPGSNAIYLHSLVYQIMVCVDSKSEFYGKKYKLAVCTSTFVYSTLCMGNTLKKWGGGGWGAESNLYVYLGIACNLG